MGEHVGPHLIQRTKPKSLHGTGYPVVGAIIELDVSYVSTGTDGVRPATLTKLPGPFSRCKNKQW